MFKKFLLAVAIVLMAVSAQAADTFQWDTFNLGGDTHYLFKHNSLAIGSGTDIMSIKDTVRLRGVYAKPIDVADVSDYVGVGVGVNISDLANKLGGVWLLSALNTSIGVSGLTDMNKLTHEGKFEGDVSLYVTLINIVK